MANTSRKILYIMPTAEVFGAERLTLSFVRHHDRARYEPSILFFNPGPMVEKARQIEGVRVHVLKHPPRLSRPAQLFRAVRECHQILDREGISLAHCCLPYSLIVIAPSAQRLGVPCVLYQHGPVEGLLSCAVGLVPGSSVLVNSKFTLQRQRKLAPLKRMKVLYPGLSPWNERTETLSPLNIDERSTVVGMLARFEPGKGIHIGIRAMVSHLRGRPNVHLVIVGAAHRELHQAYASSLRELVRAEGLERQVWFTGIQSDVRPFLERMDIVVHPSTQPEAFGLAVAEAMAAGKAVVAPNAGAIPEIMHDETHGLLHRPGDVADLSAKIGRLLEDSSLRERLGRAARDRICVEFSIDRMMHELESFYDDLFLTCPSREAVTSPML